ncbi:MAG: ABC transporter ATP-binding protein [Candidatus Limiplasma sp.]|nr:ABC transporter ATP-binding protein [Candidatus Limiplasma sp.]
MSLTVRNLGFSYGARPVLAEVSFAARSGTLTAVLGPNGAGKTTLFRCILGLQPAYSGQILLEGADLRTLSVREVAHRIAYIPQTHGIAFGYTALDMVLMGTAHTLRSVAVPGATETGRALAALERLGVAHLKNQVYAQLSGGEQQLVLIARALTQEAKTLLMDEPTSSLDYGNQARVLEVVRGLAAEGYTVLLSTHNPQHALWYADVLLALADGRVAAQGEPAALLDAALLKRLYGIQAQVLDTAQGPLIAPERAGR